MSAALISLGANQGNKRQFLDVAVEKLRQTEGIEKVVASAYVATIPIGGPTGQGEFLNAAARVKTALGPRQLFRALQQIELELDRVRLVHWGPRSIDLDLLLYGDQVISEPDLQVPHRFLAFRRFVLEPACEIAGDLKHPLLDCTIQELADHARQFADSFDFFGEGQLTLTVAQSVADQLHYELSKIGQHYRVAAIGVQTQMAKATFHLSRENTRRGMPPWLDLPETNPERAIDEAIAAIRSMQWNDADATTPHHPR